MSPRPVFASSLAIGALAFLTFGFSPPEPHYGANVIHDFGCGIAGSPIGAPDMFTTDSHAVVTPKGNTQFKCTGDLAPGTEPPRAVRLEGLGCGTPGGFTFNSVNIYTPGGKAHLICSIRPGN